jgi:hypothetical protein
MAHVLRWSCEDHGDGVENLVLTRRYYAVSKGDGRVSTPRNNASQQGEIWTLELGITGYPRAVPLPTDVKERNQIIFEAVLPVVLVEGLHSSHQPGDAREQKAVSSRLSCEMQEAIYDFRHSKPTLSSLSENVFQIHEYASIRRVACELVHTGVKSKKLKNHPVEVV